VTLSVGRTVWVPCEVKPGPFSNERLVRVQGREPESWVGFVPIWYLQEPVEQGETKIRAVVVEVELKGDRFVARIPGHSVASQLVVEATEKATPIGAL
jgi:hypothetical protein